MTDSIHIELTTRCTIACPACPRTWFSEKFNKPFPKFDIDNARLISFLDCEDGRKVSRFLLEGNHGDSIYYPDLLEFIDHWRATKSFTLYTNGSYRSVEWWQEFSSKLTADDVIIFSIDGDKETNHLYRKNSDWDSIMAGLAVVTKSAARVIWRTILFKTNEHQIDRLKQLAIDSGADEFILELSHRFGNDDIYKPIKFITVNENLADSIEPKCKNNESLYISAEGALAPCCWVSSYFTYFSTEFWKNRELWTISDTTLTEFNRSQQLNNFVNFTKDNYNDAYSVCQHNCNSNTKTVKYYEQRLFTRPTKTFY